MSGDLQEPGPPGCALVEIGDKVNGFLDRSLEGDWPYLWLDATYVKVARGRAHRLGRGDRGCGRQRPGPAARSWLMAIGASEAEAFCTEFLRLARDSRRWMRGVKLLISDDHKGLPGRRDPDPRGATWQSCRVHFARNRAGPCRPPGPVASSPPSSPPPSSPPPSPVSRRRTAREGPVASGRRPAEAKVPQAGSSHGRSRARRPRLHDFRPKEHRQKLHSTNRIERLHAEDQAAAPTSSASFPTEAAITRLVGAILLEQNDEWDRLKEIHERWNQSLR